MRRSANLDSSTDVKGKHSVLKLFLCQQNIVMCQDAERWGWGAVPEDLERLEDTLWVSASLFARSPWPTSRPRSMEILQLQELRRTALDLRQLLFNERIIQLFLLEGYIILKL